MNEDNLINEAQVEVGYTHNMRINNGQGNRALNTDIGYTHNMRINNGRGNRAVTLFYLGGFYLSENLTEDFRCQFEYNCFSLKHGHYANNNCAQILLNTLIRSGHRNTAPIRQHSYICVDAKISGVARVSCALGQEIFLRPLSTKTTEF